MSAAAEADYLRAMNEKLSNIIEHLTTFLGRQHFIVQTLFEILLANERRIRAAQILGCKSSETNLSSESDVSEERA